MAKPADYDITQMTVAEAVRVIAETCSRADLQCLADQERSGCARKAVMFMIEKQDEIIERFPDIAPEELSEFSSRMYRLFSLGEIFEADHEETLREEEEAKRLAARYRSRHMPQVVTECVKRGHRRRDAEEVAERLWDYYRESDGVEYWLEMTLNQLEMEGRHKHKVVTECVKRGYRRRDAEKAFDEVFGEYTDDPFGFVEHAHWYEGGIEAELFDEAQAEPRCLECGTPIEQDRNYCSDCGIPDKEAFAEFEGTFAEFKVFLVFTLWCLENISEEERNYRAGH